MRFFVVPSGGALPTAPDTCALREDGWDDWFKYNTLYVLYVRDTQGVQHRIGGVKIGQFDMPLGQRRPALPREFERLETDFFSLGQDDSYYTSLHSLGESVRDEVYAALRDMAADLPLFERASLEPVTQSSLLRSVSARTVRRSLHQLAFGNAQLTSYRFGFAISAPKGSGRQDAKPLELTFEVNPLSSPPTNIHVLIGRNGVGKTHTLRSITHSLLDMSNETTSFGLYDEDEDERVISNLVSVTFSAFDPFVPYGDQTQKSSGIRYAYVGLRNPKDVEDVAGNDAKTPRRDKAEKTVRVSMKDEEELAREFGRSLRACHKLGKVARWRMALETLESDPLFRAARVSSLGNSQDDDSDIRIKARKRFRRLSSGHKIVLLTITRLVELVDDRTLVLLDEPEAHLHPPLLSAFVRALSQLLLQRNGVAIIATHSPVILQEVPASCVSLLRRSGSVARAERPEIETFGENVGVLTREVFGLEVTRSGFHRMITDAVRKDLSFEDVLGEFQGKMGAEARALVRALVANRDRSRYESPDTDDESR